MEYNERIEREKQNKDIRPNVISMDQYLEEQENMISGTYDTMHNALTTTTNDQIVTASNVIFSPIENKINVADYFKNKYENDNRSDTEKANNILACIEPEGSCFDVPR